MIYDDLTASMGVPDRPSPYPRVKAATERLEAPQPCTCDVAARLNSLESLVRRLLPAESVQDDLTADDHLAVRTGNGLRPEDAALTQPPQRADWRPDAHG